jgi:signal transduction histidine kinase
MGIMKELSLIQRYSIAALITMILVSLGIGYIITSSMNRNFFLHSVEEAEKMIYQETTERFTAEELKTPVSGPDYSGFLKRLNQVSLGSDIHLFKVWNNEMLIVESNLKELIGKRFPDNSMLHKAFAGNVVWKIANRSQLKNEYYHDVGVEDVLNLYIPVRFDPGGPIDNVIEIYRDAEPVYLSIIKHKRAVWFWTFMGFVSMNLVLFWIVRNASKQMDFQTAELTQSKKDWEESFNTITDMITIHDKDYNIIRANKAARKLLKLPNLVINKETKCFRHYHGTDKPPEGCPSCACYQSGIPANFELYEPHLGKYIEIRALPRIDSKRQIIGLIHVVRDISQRKQWEKQLENSQRELRNLTAHLISVREEERLLVAREIHDELAQTLTTLNMELLDLDRKLPESSAELHEITGSMAKVIDSSIDTVKKISSDLRPKLLDDLGLQAAIKWHLKKLTGKGGAECNISLDFRENHMHRNCAITVFRIFQEAVTNVVRHANASKIEVLLKEYAGSLLINVKDNGVGITEEQISSPGSIGLIGLRERVRLCNGSIKISGAPGQGTSISVSIPLDVEMEDQQHVSDILK